jgi:4-hydroxybenzoate polyprenyltransferase
MDKVMAYANLMRLHRPIGIFLLLWPTLWALLIVEKGYISWQLSVIFILGVILMRSAGCVINDLVDRRFDGFVQRTRSRPLVTGDVSIKAAGFLFAILVLLAASLLLFLNHLTFYLALIAIVLAIIYPFSKRYTHLPQLVLGATFNWGVLMAFTAVNNTLSLLAVLVFFIAYLWTVAYDTLYAMVDREDDLIIGIKSTAILFGNADRLIIFLLQCLILILLILLGISLSLSAIFYVSVLIAGSLFIYQQYLIKDRDPQKCFKAFQNNNYFGLIIFLGIFLSYWKVIL